MIVCPLGSLISRRAFRHASETIATGTSGAADACLCRSRRPGQQSACRCRVPSRPSARLDWVPQRQSIRTGLRYRPVRHGFPARLREEHLRDLPILLPKVSGDRDAMRAAAPGLLGLLGLVRLGSEDVQANRDMFADLPNPPSPFNEW